jgi:hypothetical protein
VNVSWPSGLGAILAVVILVLAIVFIVLGQLPLMIGLFLAGLALCRLC